MHQPLRFLPALLALLLTASLVAQTEELDKQRQKTNSQITKALVAFGRRAEGSKIPSLARKAYRQILAHYDRDNNTARKGLGYRKKNDAWVRVISDDKLPKDVADARKRSSVEKAWLTTRRRVGKMHRQLASKLREAGHTTLAEEQSRRVLFFEPQDKESHIALGNSSVNGFYGDDTQIEFINRMQEMLSKASEIAEKEYEITPLTAADMPAELKASGMPFFGAKSKHFKHWVIDSQEDAIASLQWSERAYEMLGELLGNKSRFRRPGNREWLAVVRTDEQREQLWAKAPATVGDRTIDQARLFSGNSFKTSKGGRAGIFMHEKRLDADHSVANVTKVHFLGRRNDGLGEGLVHAMTWMLCGSTLTYYASLPKTVSGDFKLLEPNPEIWLERLHEEIATHQDWPLVQIPRERSDNFRESVRIKSWAFMVWLVARYPNRWFPLLNELSTSELMPEDVTKSIEETLERPLPEIEAEWREWCRKGSGIGRASGW